MLNFAFDLYLNEMVIFVFIQVETFSIKKNGCKIYKGLFCVRK